MAIIEIEDGSLHVHVQGFDRVLALKSTVTVPLQHVVAVEQNLAEASAIWHGLKAGTVIPGVLAAGRFWSKGEWTFWDIHDPAKAVIIRLAHEHYGRLVIGVDDPRSEAVTETIRRALGQQSASPEEVSARTN